MLQPLLIDLQIPLLPTPLYRDHDARYVRASASNGSRGLLLALPRLVRRPQRDVRLPVTGVHGRDLPAAGVEGENVARGVDDGCVAPCEGGGLGRRDHACEAGDAHGAAGVGGVGGGRGDAVGTGREVVDPEGDLAAGNARRERHLPADPLAVLP